MYRENTSAVRRRRALGWLAGLLAAVLLLAGGRVLAGRMQRDMNDQAATALKATVMDAVVQCYAVEGSYPESVEYLETAYGLQINHEKFYVTYDAFASNQLPDVQILKK